jgi:LPXTG-site transpeptidase (sortase) family protein
MKTVQRIVGTILVIIGIAIMLTPLYHTGEAWYYQWQLCRSIAVLPTGETPPANGGNTADTGFKEPISLEEDEQPALEGVQSERPSVVSTGTEPLFLEIPALDLEVAVVRGTEREQLKKGPGLYENSPLPGIADEANVAIAGHRTTYGAWFRHADKLEPGDVIRLTVGSDTYVYHVEQVFPVAKDDWSVVEPVGYDALTLTTCHPPGSSRERLVVRACLVGTKGIIRTR